MVGSTSAVQQTTGPSALMLASPVRIPTCSGPSSSRGRRISRRERLDRARVERDPPLAESLEVEPEGDERLPRPGRRPEDDVLARHDLEERLFLCRVERQPGVRNPVEEEAEDLVGVGGAARRDAIGEGGDVTRLFRGSFDVRHGAAAEFPISRTAPPEVPRGLEGRSGPRRRETGTWAYRPLLVPNGPDEPCAGPTRRA